MKRQKERVGRRDGRENRGSKCDATQRGGRDERDLKVNMKKKRR